MHILGVSLQISAPHLAEIRFQCPRTRFYKTLVYALIQPSLGCSEQLKAARHSYATPVPVNSLPTIHFVVAINANA